MGCTKKISNPAYRGVWSPPIIDNPEYKGVWKAKVIENPNYFDSKNPSDLSKKQIGAVAIEILASERGITFDNIVISHDLEAIKEFTELTFNPKQKYEHQKVDYELRKIKKDKRNKQWEEGYFGKVEYAFGEALDIFTVYFVPLVVAFFVCLLGSVYWCFFTGPTGGNRRSNAELEELQQEEEEEEEDDVAIVGKLVKELDDATKAKEEENKKNIKSNKVIDDGSIKKN